MVVHCAKNGPSHERHVPDRVVDVLGEPEPHMKVTQSNVAPNRRWGDDVRER